VRPVSGTPRGAIRPGARDQRRSWSCAAAAGVAVYSARSVPLAAWTAGYELANLAADADRACLVLETGVNQRWRYGSYRRSPENTAEARAWQDAKAAVRRAHPRGRARALTLNPRTPRLPSGARSAAAPGPRPARLGRGPRLSRSGEGRVPRLSASALASCGGVRTHLVRVLVAPVQHIQAAVPQLASARCRAPAAAPEARPGLTGGRPPRRAGACTSWWFRRTGTPRSARACGSCRTASCPRCDRARARAPATSLCTSWLAQRQLLGTVCVVAGREVA